MSETVTVTMDADVAAAVHQLATRMLTAWDGEEGPHVDYMTDARRSMERGLRAIGYAPDGIGQWIRQVGRRR